MSIAEMIMQGGNQQSKSWSVLSENLGRLGQEVGNQLAMREYQKQAATALPAMQAAYKSAMDDVAAGEVTQGYRKFMDAQFQFGASQNPFIAQANEAAGTIFQNASTMYEKQQQRKAQYGGGVGGGAGLPVMTPKEAAEIALLGETPTETSVSGMETIEVDPATGRPIATKTDTINVETILPEMEGVGATDVSASLIDIANTAKSAKFKSALTEAAKNPPNEATLQDVKAARDNYLALKEDEKKSLIDSYTSKFKERKEAESSAGKNFYRIEGAEKILGKQYEGIILKPSVEAKGTTIGKSQSVSYGTNAEEIRNFSKSIDGAISELNQGKIGNFISNSGGAFNVEKETIEEDVEDEFGQIKKSQTTYLIDKNNPDNRIKIPDVGGSGKGIVASLEIIKGIPSELQRLNNRGATASLVSVQRPVGKGPTAEAAKGLPAMTATQPTKRKVEVLTDKSGRYYLNAKGQKVYIK
jgi:hypothetical protein